MATDEGSRPDHLTHLAGLEREPQAYHLFQALRIIEAANPDAPRLGKSRRPRQDKVRIAQEAELAFPPSSIANYVPGTGGKPAKLTNRVFGLFGPQGPLPLHLTEYARDRQRNHRDPTFRAFADMLTHRLGTLFYRAWMEGQPAPSFDRGDDDPMRRRVAAIAGYNGKALEGRDAMPDDARCHFAGRLSSGPRNPEGLAAILSAFFRAPVRVEEFIGSWLELEKGDRWILGGAARLGQSTSIGSRVWSRSAKFRLHVGPLSRDEYERLLPGGSSLARLVAIVRNYVGEALDFDVNLVLRAGDVPAAELGRSMRLGHTSWLGKRRSTADAADLFLHPQSTYENVQGLAPAVHKGGTAA